MNMKTNQVKNEIQSNLNKLEQHIPVRIQSLLEQFISEDLSKIEEMDLFEIFVRLILKADQEPAAYIADLMVPLDTEGANQLEEWTISNSAAFLRDYLKKEYVLYILKNKNSGKS